MNALKAIKWNSIVNTLIFFALGLLLLIFPIESLSIGGYLIASIFMLVGLGSFIRIIQNKGIETSADIFYILFGIALIAAIALEFIVGSGNIISIAIIYKILAFVVYAFLARLIIFMW
jgi:hypothetical protein